MYDSLQYLIDLSNIFTHHLLAYDCVKKRKVYLTKT